MALAGMTRFSPLCLSQLCSMLACTWFHSTIRDEEEAEMLQHFFQALLYHVGSCLIDKASHVTELRVSLQRAPPRAWIQERHEPLGPFTLPLMPREKKNVVMGMPGWLN